MLKPEKQVLLSSTGELWLFGSDIFLTKRLEAIWWSTEPNSIMLIIIGVSKDPKEAKLLVNNRVNIDSRKFFESFFFETPAKCAFKLGEF